MEEKIAEILEQLVKSIVNISPKIWEIMLKQVYAEMARDVFLCILGFIFLIVGILVVRWTTRKVDFADKFVEKIYHEKNKYGWKYEYDQDKFKSMNDFKNDTCGYYYFCSAISTALGISLLVINTLRVISLAMNPEYYAILNIINLAK